MRPLRTSSPVLLATTLAALAMGACRDTPAASSPQPERQGVPGFFDPQPGESWTYAVTRDFAPGTRLRPSEKAMATELPDGAKRITFARRRICAGTERPNGAEKDLTAFTLYEDGHLVEREFYDITSAGMIGRGWTPASEITPAVTPPPKRILLNPGVTIALPRMTGGQSWTAPGAKSGPFFQLDVIERATLTVPAGEFETSRIRLTSQGPNRSTKRSVWFAENVGIVKEEITHYGPDHILVKEELVLTDWSVPDWDTPTPEPELPADHGGPEPEAPDAPPPAPDTGSDDPTDAPGPGDADRPVPHAEPEPAEDSAHEADQAEDTTDHGEANKTSDPDEAGMAAMTPKPEVTDGTGTPDAGANDQDAAHTPADTEKEAKEKEAREKEAREKEAKEKKAKEKKAKEKAREKEKEKNKEPAPPKAEIVEE